MQNNFENLNLDIYLELLWHVRPFDPLALGCVSASKEEDDAHDDDDDDDKYDTSDSGSDDQPFLRRVAGRCSTIRLGKTCIWKWLYGLRKFVDIISSLDFERCMPWAWS